MALLRRRPGLAGSGSKHAHMPTPRSVSPPAIVNIEDLRKRRSAGCRAPCSITSTAAPTREITLRENCRAFDDVTLPAALRRRDAGVRPGTTVLGTPARAPASCSRRSAAAACSIRAAKRWRRAPRERPALRTSSRRFPAACSKMFARRRTGPAWYQLYLVGGRDVALGAIERAREAGYSALVVTIDTPVAGLRERDLRNGMKELLTRNPWTMLPFVRQFARPAALARGLLRRRRPDELPQRRAAGRRPDALRRRRQRCSSSPPSPGPISAGSATRGRGRSSSRACTSATMRGARWT